MYLLRYSQNVIFVNVEILESTKVDFDLNSSSSNYGYLIWN